MGERPDWTDCVLQGLAYWIGYKKQYYRHYPLSEGAIVGEVLSLLASNLDRDILLESEVMFKNFCTDWKGNGRADIVISKKNNQIDIQNNLNIIIEVKREEAPKHQINKDLERLAKFKEQCENSDKRCFLILVSQGKRPSDFVTENGNAKHAEIKIPNSKFCIAKTRRVCKAISKFDKLNGNTTIKAAKDAHYACLIEVLKR